MIFGLQMMIMCVSVCICVRVFSCICVCVHCCVLKMCVCVHTDTHTHQHTREGTLHLPITQHTRHIHMTRDTASSSLPSSHPLIPHTNLLPPDMVMMQEGCTPLFFSSKNGHGGVVEVLLKNGANIEAVTPVGVLLLCCREWF